MPTHRHFYTNLLSFDYGHDKNQFATVQGTLARSVLSTDSVPHGLLSWIGMVMETQALL